MVIDKFGAVVVFPQLIGMVILFGVPLVFTEMLSCFFYHPPLFVAIQGDTVGASGVFQMLVNDYFPCVPPFLERRFLVPFPIFGFSEGVTV